MFKRLTAPQRNALRALRALGRMVVTPPDARPLRALQRRGYLRYKRIDGIRYAVLRLNVKELKALNRRCHNVPRDMLHLFWANWNEARLRRKCNEQK